MNSAIKQQLMNAFKQPKQKFCYYTGKNDPRIGYLLGEKQWDWTPQETVNVEPYFWNTHTPALAMSCKARLTSEGKEWLQPLIFHPDQVADMGIPDPTSGRTGKILEIIRSLVREKPPETLICQKDISASG